MVLDENYLSAPEIKFTLQEIQRGSGQASIYLYALKNLNHQTSIDILCRLAIEQPEEFPLARQIVLEKGYVPGSVYQQILFFYATEQWDKLDALAPNHLTFSLALQEASPELRRKIIKLSRRVGRAYLVKQALAEAVSGELPPIEQEILLTDLAEQEKWPELWQMAQASPPYRSARILQRLAQSGWQPATDAERKSFKKLVRLAHPCRIVPFQGRLTERLQKFKFSSNSTTPGFYHSEKITPDAKYLVIAYEREIEFYNLEDGKLEFSLEGVSQPDVYIPWQELRFSQDCRFLFYQSATYPAIPYSQYYLNILDMQEKRVVASLEDFENNPQDYSLSVISFSQNELLVYGKRRSDKYNYWIFNLSTQTITGSLDGPPPYGLRGLAISPNKLLLAGRDAYDTLWVWSIPDNEFVVSLPDSESNSLFSLEFSPDSAMLAYATPAGVYLLDVATGDKRELELSRYHRPTTLRFSPDGQILAVGYFEANVVVLWHVGEARPLQTLKWLDDMVIDLAFSPDGTRLVTLSRKLQVQVWQSCLPAICERPPLKNSLRDLEWLQRHKQDSALRQGAERAWLKFCEALLLWNWRYDVLLETAIAPTPVDIELEELED